MVEAPGRSRGLNDVIAEYWSPGRPMLGLSFVPRARQGGRLDPRREPRPVLEAQSQAREHKLGFLGWSNGLQERKLYGWRHGMPAPGTCGGPQTLTGRARPATAGPNRGALLSLHRITRVHWTRRQSYHAALVVGLTIVAVSLSMVVGPTPLPAIPVAPELSIDPLAAERRATYERLALEASANVDEEALYPDEPDDELWGSYTGPGAYRAVVRSLPPSLGPACTPTDHTGVGPG